MSANNSSGGIGFFGLLTVAFIVLKLTKVINWSWWLVLLPAYGGLILVVVALIIFFAATQGNRRAKWQMI